MLSPSPVVSRALTSVLDELRTDAARAWIALPKKPRRNSHFAVVFCLVLRLEVFLAVSRESQCSSPGVEVCTPPGFSSCLS